MRLLIEIILLTSIWTIGITIASQQGMLLYSLRVWAGERQSKIMDAVIICPYCMPSLHSFLGYGFAVGIGLINSFSCKLILMWPLVVCGSSVLNSLLWGIASLLMSANTYYEALMQPQEPNDERPIDEEPKEHYLKDAINSGVS